MTKLDLKNLERISDYSIALMGEISGDIRKLSDYSSSKVENKLDDINRKIDLARSYGVNVAELDKQILDFRLVLFKRDIRNKIEESHTHLNNLSLDISKIELEYGELKKELGIDCVMLEKKMEELHNELLRAKIKFMIKGIKDSEGMAAYTIEEIAIEIEVAKKKGIYVDDIEEMLFG